MAEKILCSQEFDLDISYVWLPVIIGVVYSLFMYLVLVVCYLEPFVCYLEPFVNYLCAIWSLSLLCAICNKLLLVHYCFC